MNFIDKALDIHARALDVRSRRMEVLARNIANADTPHFKARDVDFRSVLSNARHEPMVATRKGHVDSAVQDNLSPLPSVKTRERALPGVALTRLATSPSPAARWAP